MKDSYERDDNRKCVSCIFLRVLIYYFDQPYYVPRLEGPGIESRWG